MKLVHVLCFPDGRMVVTTTPDTQLFVVVKALFVLPAGDQQTFRELLALHIRLKYTNPAHATEAHKAFDAIG